MDPIKSALQSRQNYLFTCKKAKENALRHAPDRALRILNTGKNTYYYHRQSKKDFDGTYIRKENFPLAMQLAQKSYDEKVLRSVNQELNAIQHFLSASPNLSAEEVYQTLSSKRQELVMPISETDEQFVQNWKSVEYVGKSFDFHTPKLYTAQGEQVRSKSEIIIADSLYRENIPYRYECPLYLEGAGTIHPDFTVLNVRLRKVFYWEHLGMMDDPDYSEKAVKRIQSYEQNGFYQGDNLILTYETRQFPLNPKHIKNLISHFLL